VRARAESAFTSSWRARRDYFGEISLIDGKPRSATVRAESDLTTASLVTWNFRPLLDEVPGLAQALLLVLCERLRAVEQAASR